MTPMNTQMKTLRSNTCRILFATCLSALCLTVLRTQAATITVSNGFDSGPGSLRQALASANDGDTINFAVTGTITLTTDELLVDKSITISGPGSDNLTVDGNHASHIFHVSGGVTATVAGLSITNGGEVPGAGGGIYNDHSTLAIDHCTVSGNHGSVGGGVYNDGYSGTATLTVTNSTFSGNSVAAPYSVGSGGGIYNNGSYGSATLTVANSTFSGNSAIDAGDPNFNPNSFNPPMVYDQRGTGFNRVVNGRIDIGAFEVQAVPSPYAGQVQQPINADGSSVFSVRRGVVPVKFTLTQGGVATCALPPATIAITRTAGGTPGQIDESVYR